MAGSIVEPVSRVVRGDARLGAREMGREVILEAPMVRAETLLATWAAGTRGPTG
jgi:hypothetical protein